MVGVGLGWGLGGVTGKKAEMQGLKRERKTERGDSKGLLMSSRAESSDSNRDFRIMILQQCIAYFKDLITTAY